MTVSHFLEIISLSVFGLLPIMNPFSTAPLFLSLTTTLSEQERRQQALKGCIYAGGILLTFLLLGSLIIQFFGISIPGIRVAGGLIISFIGFRMLFPDPHANARAASKVQQGQQVDIAFTPLAMPSLAGPGSISLALSAAGRIGHNVEFGTFLSYLAVIIGIVITLIIAYVTLIGAGYLVRFLGKSGTDAMTRIFGFLLICIGVQFFLTGIASFFDLGLG